MKYFKRAGIYKASNITFDPKALDARSYVWWSFVKKIDGKLIFNNYKYSPSTGRHQYKIRGLLEELGIKINLELPLPEGLQVYTTLADAILDAEEYLCEKYLEEELKKEERNLKSKHRRYAAKLSAYLENEVHFRDYEIKQKRQFGHIHTIAVHQVVDLKSMDHDVMNALHNFQRDGFEKIVFYV